MRKRIAIIGNFGDVSKQASDGQTIKTRVVTNELIKYYGEDEVITFNTYGGIINLFKAPIICIKALCKASNVIIFPAYNGVRVFAPLLSILSFFFINCRLHYCVIGGWLPSFIKNKPILSKSLKGFYAIYVETYTMKDNLNKDDFENVEIMPNFKDVKIIENRNLETGSSMPYKLCTFSRIMREKGIGDAVEVITKINTKLNKVVYQLDIYGNIDEKQIEWFQELQSSFPEYISYKGCVDYNKSVETLQNYFALLFPTYYEGEGFAGTIIDAFAAGLPVIATDWKYNAEIVKNNICGYIYPTRDNNALCKLLEDIYQNPSKVADLKNNCLEAAKQYLPKQALSVLINNIK